MGVDPPDDSTPALAQDEGEKSMWRVRRRSSVLTWRNHSSKASQCRWSYALWQLVRILKICQGLLFAWSTGTLLKRNQNHLETKDNLRCIRTQNGNTFNSLNEMHMSTISATRASNRSSEGMSFLYPYLKCTSLFILSIRMILVRIWQWAQGQDSRSGKAFWFPVKFWTLSTSWATEKPNNSGKVLSLNKATTIYR